MIPIVDTHQHLLLSERWPYSWTKDASFLDSRPYGLEEYETLANEAGISYSIFMETTPDHPHWLEESRYVFDLCSMPDNRMVGAVINCRPESSDFAAYLDERENEYCVGVRRILHTAPDEISQTSLFRENVRGLSSRNLSFDLCFLARQLPLAIDLAKACPDVQFVLDHCGIPDMSSGAMELWMKRISLLSELENVACKISGVIAYCAPGEATESTVKPYVEHCIESFGWDRVVWGGDWPVCTRDSSLPSWVSISRSLVSKEDTRNQTKLFYDNALAIYGVKTLSKS